MTLPPSVILPAEREPEEKPAPPPVCAAEGSEDELWEEALALFAEEKFDEARERFQKMALQNQRSARALLGLGLISANMGDEKKAREQAEKASQFDDLLPELYFLHALLDEKGGELERAVQNYQRVILLSPEFAMAHFNLGHLHLKMNQERMAKREFRNTVSILEGDENNCSLHFSGGLSRESVIQFCRMQLE